MLLGGPPGSLMLPHIPLCVPDLRGREAELLANCIRENWVSSTGPAVTEFENEVARRLGCDHAVALVNGTCALHLALVVNGIGPGDRVAVPDWTFAATANAVAHAGAEPIFVDIRDSDWAISPDLVATVLKQDPTVKAVIAVDPLGHAADFDAVEPVCREQGAILIEDAAGAIGGTYKGRPCGSLGEIATLSFNGNKTITTGCGGMLLTSSAGTADLVRHLSSQASTSRNYTYDRIGYNFRMANLNAAVGIAQLERLDSIIAAKAKIAARYDESLLRRYDIWPMPRPEHSVGSCWLYSVRLRTVDDAESLIAHLERAGIESRRFWSSLSLQKPWVSSQTMLNGVSRALTGCVVSLPSSSSLSSAEQDRVLRSLAEWQGNEFGETRAAV